MSASDETARRERESRQHKLDLMAANENTVALRSSTQPRWQRLRQRLEEEGIDPEDAAIPDRHTEDTALEFGIVVAKDGRAFSFEFDFLRDEKGLELEYEDARVTAWEELNEHRRQIYQREVALGQQVLKGDAFESN